MAAILPLPPPARLRDCMTGHEVAVLSAHINYRSRNNRLRSAERVAAWVAAPLAARDRVSVAGDMNARLGSATHRILEAAGLQFLPVQEATYHFDRGLDLFGAIDRLAHGPGVVPDGQPVVLRQDFGGVWPSDHYPVVAVFRLD